ncbi:hypothetical protein OPAG_05161 [Rhodococcus opacus PD630]|nr:hypothetical protein OPAG_05161 [Rhodococcus opacus PD630]UDG94320.1 Lsr2 family protein [Rhodococcus opacus PD630]
MHSTVARRRRRHMAVSPRGSEGSAKKTTKEIREWAIGEGREVSSRGRISAEIEQAFHDAQAKKVPAKTVSVKKTAVTTTAGKKIVAKKAPVTRAAASAAPVTKAAAKKTAATKAAAEKTAVKQPVAAKVPVKRAVVSRAPAKKLSREIREWAIGVGHEVSSRGRISAEIEQAFHDAQAKKIQAKTAPVRKTAATKAAAEKNAVKQPVAAKVPVKRAVVSRAPAKKSSREIREWAIGVGHEVSSRGRISAEIEQAFHDAQAKKIQAKTALVTKTAAKKTVPNKAVAKNVAAEKTAVKKKVAAKVPVKRAAVRKAPAKKSPKEIREWAIGVGHEVSSRGRIPAELERAFHDAQVEMPVA